MTAALAGFGAVFALLFMRVPIAFGMAIVGFVGFALLIGWMPSLAMVGQIAYDTPVSYGLIVLPLFILMGNLIARAGLSTELYNAAYSVLGHQRGGLALTTLTACAGFSAVCGSSLATAATMSKVAMPQMRNYNYADSLATGSIAAGGTLGILIPPSVALVIYGIMTSSDIGKLFIAGIVPGLLGLFLYSIAAWLVAYRRPDLGPRGQRFSMRERLKAMRGIWGIAVLFAVVMGGIYFGFFTPTEAASVGAGGAFLFALLRGTLTVSVLIDILSETARMTAMIFAILIGAFLFSNFINVAGLPAALASWVNSVGASPALVILAILAIYVVLGCVLESMSMMLLTIPIFFPIITALGFDPIWFGIIVVVVIEISLITPPIGLNVFVLKATLPDVRTRDIFVGVIPFILADVVRLAVLVLFPGVVLFLPSLMN